MNNKVVGIDGKPVKEENDNTPQPKIFKIVTYDGLTEEYEEHIIEGFLGITPEYIMVGQGDGTAEFVFPHDTVKYVKRVFPEAEGNA